MKKFKDEKKILSYETHYYEGKFIAKMIKITKKTCVKLVYTTFIFYYAVSDPDFPTKENTLVPRALVSRQQRNSLNLHI